MILVLADPKQRGFLCGAGERIHKILLHILAQSGEGSWPCLVGFVVGAKFLGKEDQGWPKL